jgi:hypothetical protein
MFTEWQKSVKELSLTLTSLLKEKKKLQLTAQEKNTLRETERSLQTIKLDGSSGIHNYMFMEEVLTNLIKNLK